MTAATRETTPNPGDPGADDVALPPIAPMRNPVRDYDWGSTSVLARMQGREPAGGPEAELWMGAHPSAPSALLPAGEDGPELPLPEAVAAAPRALLGADVLARFGARLPFMLKVLAVAQPLSLQVHPDAERARAAHDPAGGSPYVDPFHKPELIVAVEEMEAIFGFRTAPAAAVLLGRLGAHGVPVATRLAEGLLAGLDAGTPGETLLHAALADLVGLPAEERPALVAAAATAAKSLAAEAEDDAVADAARWVGAIAALHPADPLVLAPLLLGLVRLAPGEALFVPAGVPHAYLTGTGVEVLAASDNVVRAGLTGKPVDAEELLRIVDCTPHDDARTAPRVLSGHEVAWRPGVADFQLTRIVAEGTPVAADPSVTGPQILLVVDGTVTVTVPGPDGVALSQTIAAGRSAFVAAAAGPLTITGTGTLFRAAPGSAQTS